MDHNRNARGHPPSARDPSPTDRLIQLAGEALKNRFVAEMSADEARDDNGDFITGVGRCIELSLEALREALKRLQFYLKKPSNDPTLQEDQQMIETYVEAVSRTVHLTAEQLHELIADIPDERLRPSRITSQLIATNAVMQCKSDLESWRSRWAGV